MISTYTELQAAIARDLGRRADLGPQIADWIYLLEQDLNLILQRREMMQRATAQTTANVAAYALPGDYGGEGELHLDADPITWIEPSNWNRIVLRYQNRSGSPRAWSIVQNEILLGPPPDGVYTLELYYRLMLPNLSATMASNWLLQKFPSVYYYGTLDYAAHSVTTAPEDALRWGMAYERAKADLARAQARERAAGGGPILKTADASALGSGGPVFSILTGDA
jgi:hypothetical protein